MKDEFKNWNIGLLFILVISTIIYFISNIFFTNPLSLLESWGIAMLGMTIFSGFGAYKDAQDANISE